MNMHKDLHEYLVKLGFERGVGKMRLTIPEYSGGRQIGVEGAVIEESSKHSGLYEVTTYYEDVVEQDGGASVQGFFTKNQLQNNLTVMGRHLLWMGERKKESEKESET